jgi:hypothetical protein
VSKGAPCFLRKANHSNHRIGAHTGANQTVPYGTALLRWRFPGTSCQATIGLSLRDWGQSPFGPGQPRSHLTSQTLLVVAQVFFLSKMSKLQAQASSSIQPVLSLAIERSFSAVQVVYKAWGFSTMNLDLFLILIEI